MKVNNHGCIDKLSLRALFANRTRNSIAILAIALTCVLFTSLFTIIVSINEGIQQNNFRMAGGYAHGTFKYMTEKQYEQIKNDSLIQEVGLRRFLGMPTEAPFHKSHVEIGYSDSNYAHWSYCDTVEGRLPLENTQEAATDTHVLELLGIEPELGAQFTITFTVDGHETTQIFTLCGWWEYDEAIIANHILIPESRVEEILSEVGVTLPSNDGMTASWNLDVMLKNGSSSIADDLNEILQKHGYQSENRNQENYISTGVNWGYTGAQLSDKLDAATIIVLIGLLILILLTGYLIIYNVFQISVMGEIRFYGLLKTIGTTSRQIQRIVRTQAILLSLVGIPIGMIFGWFLGGVLTPIIVTQLNGVTVWVSANPILFVSAILFSLITVLISCYRPSRLAGKVSPIEAVRYTEYKTTNRKRKKSKVSLLSMACANMGRSWSKTIITVLSLALAVVLMTVTVTVTNGFDINKYVSFFTASDFIVADAKQFQVGDTGFDKDMGVSDDVIHNINEQGNITESGRVYGKITSAVEFVTEEYYRSVWSRWYTPEQVDDTIRFRDRNEQGLLSDRVQLYGMEPFALDHLTVLKGEISKLNDIDGNYIAAVYSQDDYGNINTDSHWAKIGDTVTIRYIEESEYYDTNTGVVYGSWENVPDGVNFAERAIKYKDVDYTVAALVSVPSALSYRYYGADEFVMGAKTFIRDTGTNSVMYYVFDTTQESNATMETFLQEYTQNSQFDYESKQVYAQNFESFRSMFLLLGSALSFIVGLVGVLNFFNAVVTSITARRKEFAILQAIGMTNRQLQTMLVLEGLLYTISAIIFSVVLILITAPFLQSTLQKMFWFFTYQFTVLPIITILPVFVLLGVLIPMFRCHVVQKYSVVERLRQE